jgi:hypothetical protein
MIDPKFNELPAEAEDEVEEASLTEEQRAERARRRKAGLSINDTVAANANFSVGARGVDVSGVRTGAGAGAGLTSTTPAESGESPAPQVVPGTRGSGTTPSGQVSTGQRPTMRMDEEGPTNEEIAARAHRYWVERGSPEGSAEEDWERAEQELRAERARTRTASV